MTAHALREASDRSAPQTGLPRPSPAPIDTPVDLGHPAQLLRTISAWAPQRRTRRVMYVNSHVVDQSRLTPGLGDALRRADLVYRDAGEMRRPTKPLGMPIHGRMTGAAWIWGLARLCELAGYSVYLLGSEPPIARQAAERLRRVYPRLDVVGVHHGCFDLGSPHNERVIEDIAARRPRIVLVGMGTPKQELWIDRYADRLEGAVVWAVGALFDDVSGHTPRARRRLADAGLQQIIGHALERDRMWRRCLLATVGRLNPPGRPGGAPGRGRSRPPRAPGSFPRG